MGPTQDPPERPTNQDGRREPSNSRGRRPRLRRCLLKGCGRRYRPLRPWARYCGEECRRQARRWSRWKAQKRYRATAPGKERRQAQSRRYRRRGRRGKQGRTPRQEAARVITANFFRLHVRPSWLLQDLPPEPSFSTATLLFAGVSARTGARPGAGTAVEGALRGRSRPAEAVPDGSFVLIRCAS